MKDTPAVLGSRQRVSEWRKFIKYMCTAKDTQKLATMEEAAHWMDGERGDKSLAAYVRQVVRPKKTDA